MKAKDEAEEHLTGLDMLKVEGLWRKMKKEIYRRISELHGR